MGVWIGQGEDLVGGLVGVDGVSDVGGGVATRRRFVARESPGSPMVEF